MQRERSAQNDFPTSVELEVIPLSLSFHFTEPIEATRPRGPLRHDQEAQHGPHRFPRVTHGDTRSLKDATSGSGVTSRNAIFQFQ